MQVLCYSPLWSSGGKAAASRFGILDLYWGAHAYVRLQKMSPFRCLQYIRLMLACRHGLKTASAFFMLLESGLTVIATMSKASAPFYP